MEAAMQKVVEKLGYDKLFKKQREAILQFAQYMSSSLSPLHVLAVQVVKACATTSGGKFKSPSSRIRSLCMCHVAGLWRVLINEYTQ